MSFCLRTSSALVLALLSSGVLGAQDQGQRARPPKGTPETLLRRYATQETPHSAAILKGTYRTSEDPGEKYAPGTAVPEHLREAVDGLERFATPMVGYFPHRLSPGSGGEMILTLSLRGDFVIEAGAHLELHYRKKQGPFHFGQYRIDPPTAGKHEGVYLGQPVYDDTISIFVPVSVAADAPHKEMMVDFEVEADVTDGSTGQFHSRLRGRGQGKILVGAPLPPLVLEAESKIPRSLLDKMDVVAVPANTSGAMQPVAAEAGMTANRVTPEPEVVTESDESAPASLVVPGGDSFPVVLLVAGGLAVGVIFLLLVVGRRSAK